MKSIKRKYNQNIVDFVLQNYGSIDHLIDFISLNDLEYDEFEDNDEYYVSDIIDNRIVNFYDNNEIDVINGIDETSYDNLYPDPSYYTPLSGTPSIIEYNENIILKNITDFSEWTDPWKDEYEDGNPYGESYVSGETYEYVANSGKTFAIICTKRLWDSETVLTLSDNTFEPGNYNVKILWDSSDLEVSGVCFLGGYTTLGNSNNTGYTYKNVESNLDLYLDEEDTGSIANEVYIQYVLPSGSTTTINLKEITILKT
jgi:hypothetical protein